MRDYRRDDTLVPLRSETIGKPGNRAGSTCPLVGRAGVAEPGGLVGESGVEECRSGCVRVLERDQFPRPLLLFHHS